jgi:uncharacterized protein with HEPN domain
MSIDRAAAHLSDMLGFAQELRGIAAAYRLDEFLGSRILCLATEKLFINLGEAAQRVPEVERVGMATIPWRQIIGLRNILAHGYERIDQETLYRTASNDPAAIERELTACLATRGPR